MTDDGWRTRCEWSFIFSIRAILTEADDGWLKRTTDGLTDRCEWGITWSCGSRQRDTTSSGWTFQLNNLAVKGLIFYISICCDLKSTNISNFYPVEVVCRGSETQLQLSENVDFITISICRWAGHTQKIKKNISATWWLIIYKQMYLWNPRIAFWVYSSPDNDAEWTNQFNA